MEFSIYLLAYWSSILLHANVQLSSGEVSAFVSVLFEGVFSGHHLAVIRAAFLTLAGAGTILPGPGWKASIRENVGEGSGVWFITDASTCSVFVQPGWPSVPGVVITLICYDVKHHF